MSISKSIPLYVKNRRTAWHWGNALRSQHAFLLAKINNAEAVKGWHDIPSLQLIYITFIPLTWQIRNLKKIIRQSLSTNARYIQKKDLWCHANILPWHPFAEINDPRGYPGGDCTLLGFVIFVIFFVIPFFFCTASHLINIGRSLTLVYFLLQIYAKISKNNTHTQTPALDHLLNFVCLCICMSVLGLFVGNFFFFCFVLICFCSKRVSAFSLKAH